MSLATGFATEIVAKQIITKKLPAPYSDCVKKFDSDMYKKTISINSVYSQKFCKFLGYSLFIERKCGCNDAFSVFLPHIRFCNKTDIPCVGQYSQIFFNEKATADEYFSQCPPECESYDYDLKRSQSTYPTPLYANLIINHSNNSLARSLKTLEDVRENCLSVNIYYDDISITKIEGNLFPFNRIFLLKNTFHVFYSIKILRIILLRNFLVKLAVILVLCIFNFIVCLKHFLYYFIL